jgi:hypothetical protein
MDALAIVGALLGGLGGVAALYVAIRYRSIEDYKAEIQRLGVEHEIRFARLHEKRVEVIAELYRKLVRAEGAIGAWVHPMEEAGTPSKEELGQIVNETMQDFQRYFLEHRIWLDVPLVSEIDGMIKEMREAGITYGYLVLRRPEAEDRVEHWHKAWKIMDKRVPPIRTRIERRFRQLLGIGSEGADAS